MYKSILYLFPVIIFFTLFFAFSSLAQERARICTYNLLSYPDNSAVRNPEFRKVLNEIEPDIVVTQEVKSSNGALLFLNDVLNEKFKMGRFINNPNPSATNNSIYYKDSLFTFISSDSIVSAPRWITRYRLYHNFTLDTLVIYAAHFKAGDGVSNENNRRTEATILRFHTNNSPPGTNFILAGDLNLYRSGEAAYDTLLNQNRPGYFLDPINTPGIWHEGTNFSMIHTQSTRVTNPHPPDGSLGGMDDRFDFILISQSIKDEGDIDYVEDSYISFGNDGIRCCNLPINVPPNNLVGQEIANALLNSSDHLPVIADFDFGVVNSVSEFNPSELSYNLFQNYPNPFNPITTIQFEIPYETDASLAVYDILGRKVSILHEGIISAGRHELEFNASELPSGIYLYRLVAEDYIHSRKLLLLK